MSSAMEQLAAELAKLSAEEWARLPEPQIDSVDWDALLTEVVDADQAKKEESTSSNETIARSKA